MLNENMVKKQEMLTVSHLSKNEILRDVSYSVREGEMVAIMGPSGSENLHCSMQCQHGYCGWRTDFFTGQRSTS